MQLVGPQIPSLANTAFWHTLGKTENSSKWDLRTEITVQVLRHIASGAGREPSPISKVQAMSCRPQPVKGKTWAAKTTLKAPAAGQETIREAVFKAIDDMKTGPVTYTKPELADIEVEWTGYRPDARKDEAQPNLEAAEIYKRLMGEPTRTTDVTILYFHGGAYYLLGLDSHRPLVSRLAKESGGRVCNVRYRLAPQAAFPTQLLDGLVSYLNLLYPPPGSIHEPVLAKHIVFGGDSAGGNLAFALLQLLLQFQRTGNKMTWNGKEVEVPLPAGCTANSGWFDMSRSMPSITGNVKYDYLPAANHDDALSRFPKDSIWPTNPPRGDLFCDLSLFDHPLVSVMLADSWKGSPPLWMNTGSEMLTDEDKIVAAKAAVQGVSIHYEQYEAMPHCFPMLIPHLKQSDMCLRSWGTWCKKAVEQPQTLATNGTFIYAKTGKTEPVDVTAISPISEREMKRLVSEAKERRLKGYENEGKLMPKPSL